jgi:hypothetical protein
MTAKAGERAQKTGDFYCDSCGEKVHVTKATGYPSVPMVIATLEPAVTNLDRCNTPSRDEPSGPIDGGRLSVCGSYAVVMHLSQLLRSRTDKSRYGVSTS